MAKENSEAAKKIADAEKAKTKKSKSKKKGNIFARMWKAIKSFFKNSKGDLKKITWPSGKEVVKGTVVTIVCIAIIGVIVFLIDLGLTNGIKGLRTVAENRTTTTVAAETTTAGKDDQTLVVTEPASESAKPTSPAAPEEPEAPSKPEPYPVAQ